MICKFCEKTIEDDRCKNCDAYYYQSYVDIDDSGFCEYCIVNIILIPKKFANKNWLVSIDLLSKRTYFVSAELDKKIKFDEILNITPFNIDEKIELLTFM